MSFSTLWTNSSGTLKTTLVPSKMHRPSHSSSTESTTSFSFFRDVSISIISVHILRTLIGKKDKNATLKCMTPMTTEYQNGIKADEGASIITGRQVEITVSASKCCRNVSWNTVGCHSRKEMLTFWILSVLSFLFWSFCFILYAHAKQKFKWTTMKL